MEPETKKENQDLPEPPPLVVPLPIRPIFSPAPHPFLFPTPIHSFNSLTAVRPRFNLIEHNMRFPTTSFVPKRALGSGGILIPRVGRNCGPYEGFRCTHCPKIFDSPTDFHHHMRAHMSNGCECPLCGKSFSRHWLLQGHIRTHTGEKPFKCPICTKAFADKSNLRAHIQTHSGVKPYSCKRCKKSFALKSYLSKHEESACFKTASPSSTNSKSSK